MKPSMLDTMSVPSAPASIWTVMPGAAMAAAEKVTPDAARSSPVISSVPPKS